MTHCVNIGPTRRDNCYTFFIHESTLQAISSNIKRSKNNWNKSQNICVELTMINTWVNWFVSQFASTTLFWSRNNRTKRSKSDGISQRDNRKTHSSNSKWSIRNERYLKRQTMLLNESNSIKRRARKRKKQQSHFTHHHYHAGQCFLVADVRRNFD